jgi:signal transduction histidine kinase
MNVYALLAFLSLSIFGSLNIVAEHNPLVGYLELGGALAVAITMLGLRLTSNVGLARTCLLLTIITLLVVMFTSGGTEGTGIFWAFMFPVATFFLAGKREGLYWMGLLFVVIISLWALGRGDLIHYYYSDITTRQLLVTLLVVTVGLYAYQTSRERSEQESRQSQHELQQYVRQMAALHAKVDHAKSEFVTLASHQLRTPISSIGWYSEMLLNGDAEKLGPNQEEYVQGIYESNRRLAAIVDAMLMVSSLDMGKVDVRPEPTDLRAMAHTLLRELRKKFEPKELVITEHFDENLPKLNVDPSLAKHILHNIFSNAIKYTPAKGTVTVSIAQSDTKLSPRSRGSVLISVTDNGYGIPLADRKNVFAKMFRAGNIKSQDTDGTGLGLYIVKELLDRVGGSISFTSEENKGSTFVVQLPLEGMKVGMLAKQGVVHA